MAVASRSGGRAYTHSSAPPRPGSGVGGGVRRGRSVAGGVSTPGEGLDLLRPWWRLTLLKLYDLLTVPGLACGWILPYLAYCRTGSG